ncbi:acyltransferase family protein [Humibacillus xanthopallidus]|uniref:acyltransferase family protein n=1 Tax=Humibacillus xanthopallidus TaxID=412689 RepID=UPI00384C494E
MPTRAPTRARGGLLIGAAVALVWRPGRMPACDTPRERALLDGAGVVGLVGIGLLVLHTDEYSMFLYRGGILLLSIATVLVVAAVSHPSSLVGKALGVAPLAWIGARSYGIYLWHLPVVAFTPNGLLTDHPAWRGGIQLALTLALAALSWAILEDPIRRHGFRGALRLGRPSPARPGVLAPAAPAIVVGAAVLGLVGVTALSATALAGGGHHPETALLDAGKPPLPPDAGADGGADGGDGAEPSASGTPSAGASAGASAGPTPTDLPATPTAPTAPATTAAPDLRTSCTQLVHVGDSTSTGLVDKNYLPAASKRIDAQYRRIGVRDFSPDILGARSIVERYKDQPNAEQAVVSRVSDGYDGCWVLAMGTNEVANQYVGGTVPLAQRIDLLMEPIGNHPVMWLTVKTLRSSGPWDDAEMRKWNQALVDACSRYPTMRVYDWRSEVKDSWFIDDEIHFTSAGYAQRAKRIADAFARSFPASGERASGCVVRSGD